MNADKTQNAAPRDRPGYGGFTLTTRARHPRGAAEPAHSPLPLWLRIECSRRLFTPPPPPRA
eukprot:6199611-Prymnesium_polylepis.1